MQLQKLTPPSPDLKDLDGASLRSKADWLGRLPKRSIHLITHHFRLLLSLLAVTTLLAYAVYNTPLAVAAKVFESIYLPNLAEQIFKANNAALPDYSEGNTKFVGLDDTMLITSKTEYAPNHGAYPSDNIAIPSTALANALLSYDWRTVTVAKHDSLSQIFKRYGLNIEDAHRLAKLENAVALAKIRPGQRIQFAADEQGALLALRHPINTFSTLHITRHNNVLHAEIVTRTPQIKLRHKRASIVRTLIDAAENVDIDFATVYQFAEIFGWQVDFSRDIRSGDQFAMIYEELYMDGKKVGNGDILAAELIIRNKRLRAISHVNKQYGHRLYYAANGDGIQSSFLRSPLKFGRVTSNFTRKRFHPILKKWRAHRGVDYGASRGTPIRATGDGVVAQTRTRRGYGKTVMLRHAVKYTTLYAHLQRFAKGIRPGRRVKQGEVIGYVGASGWATAPHLHYELRVNGRHRNPLTVKLPKSPAIAAQDKEDFLIQARSWISQLAQIGLSPLAQLELTK